MARAVEPAAMSREQKFWGWGEPGAGPALPGHAAGLLREWLGVSGAVVSQPVALGGRALRAPVVAAGLRAALERAVGARHVRDDRAIRVLRAAGKSYLDLLALRAGALRGRARRRRRARRPRPGRGSAGGVRRGAARR